MVCSLQRHLDKNDLTSMFESCGINGFWEFPPKNDQIKSLEGSEQAAH